MCAYEVCATEAVLDYLCKTTVKTNPCRQLCLNFLIYKCVQVSFYGSIPVLQRKGLEVLFHCVRIVLIQLLLLIELVKGEESFMSDSRNMK